MEQDENQKSEAQSERQTNQSERQNTSTSQTMQGQNNNNNNNQSEGQSERQNQSGGQGQSEQTGGGGGGSSSTQRREGSGDVDLIFSAKLTNLRTFADLLSRVNFGDKKNQKVIVTLAPSGMRFTNQDSTIQAICQLSKLSCAEYMFKGTEKQNTEENSSETFELFGINLYTLIECLNIFGKTATPINTLQIYYSGSGPLFLMLEENGATADCALKTFETDYPTNYQFKEVPVPNKVALKSEPLKEALSEFDWVGSKISLLMSPDPPHFKMVREGDYGSWQLEYPSDSPMFEKFDCTQTRSFSYKSSAVHITVRALVDAQKTMIRMNERGCLNIQHMYEDQHVVEFYINPEEITTENEGDENNEDS